MAGAVAAPDVASERSRAARLAQDARVRYVVLVGALAGSYYAAAQIGYTLKFTGAVAAIVWLPVGVGIAFLYFGGLALWPGVLLGDLLANQYQELPVGSAIGQSIGNVLEVVVATVLLRRLVRSERPLDSVPGVCGVVAAIFVGTAVSATVGPLSLRFEGAVMVITVVVLSELALRSDRPQSYIVFPALVWAALRFGPRGGTLAVAVAVGFALWKTAHHAGPFVVHSIPRSTLSTQLYVGVAALTAMFMAAVVSEREAFARGLVESRARLVGAADRERRRLEHNLHDSAQLTLTMLAVHLGAAREKAVRAPEESEALFEEAEEQAEVAIEQLRELARGIHPSVLTDLGLAEAIKSLAHHSPVPIQVLELPQARLDATAEAAAYYVVAEALTNAQRHAQAQAITIRAGGRSGKLEVEVVDDGVGGADEGLGSGLQGLRDRVEAVGGTFAVFSAPGWGTRIHATFPTGDAALGS